MKKITLLMLTLMLSAVTFAQKPEASVGSQRVLGNAAKTDVLEKAAPVSGVTPLGVSVEKEVYAAPWRVRRAASDYEIITEQPAGTLKKYFRTGSYLYSSGGSFYLGDQGGLAHIVFADDGTTVYFKDPTSYYAAGTWVKGTISGNKITVALGQNLGYYATWDVPVVLGLGYPTAMRATGTEGNVTYTIDGNTISLDAQTYNDGCLGALVPYNGTNYVMAYGDYGTVYTEFVEPDKVTPPAGLETKDVSVFAVKQGDGVNVSLTVKVGVDGDNVYIQGLSPELPEAWVKGTIADNVLTIPAGQYLGMDEDEKLYYLSAYTNGAGASDAHLDIDEAGSYTAQSGCFVFIGPNETAPGNYYYYYASLAFINEEPVAAPDGLEFKSMPFTGQYYNGSAWSSLADDATVQVGIDGDDIYVKGLFYDMPDAVVKGVFNEDKTKALFESGQYVGGGRYFYNADNEDGETAPAEFDYYAKDDLFISTSYIALNLKKRVFYFEYYYTPGLVMGVDIEPEVATLPDGLETSTVRFIGTIYRSGASLDFQQTVDIAETETSLYIKGLCSFLPDAWVVGTKDEAGNVTIPSPSKFGVVTEDGTDYPMYLIGINSAGTVDDIQLTYDAEKKAYTLATDALVNGTKRTVSFYTDYEIGSVFGVVTPVDVVVSPESGSITDAINAEIGTDGSWPRNVTVNLAADASYTLEAPIEAAKGITINGNGATIDASANDGALAQLSATPDAAIKNSNNYYEVNAEVLIKDVTIKGVKGSILSDNGQQYSLNYATIDNSVIELATAASGVNAINFQKGGIKHLTVQNSTIYQTGEANVKYFVQYVNGARYDRLGFGDGNTTITYVNNTFYKVGSDNWANYSGISNNSTYTIQKNIFVDCSGSGEVARRMLGNGRLGNNAEATFGQNTYWFNGQAQAQGNYDTTDLLTTNPYIKADWADDVTDADRFAIDAESAQALNATGDQRWATWAPEKYAVTVKAEQEHATIDVPQASYMADDVVTFTLTAEQGYAPTKVYAKAGKTAIKVTEVDAAKGIYSFTMPKLNIEVSADMALVATDFVIDIDAAGNINEAIKAETEGKTVKGLTINLNAAGTYTVTETIVSPGRLAINGVDGVVIDASAVAAPSEDGTPVSAPLLALSTTPGVGFAPKADGTGDTDYYLAPLVQLKNVKVTGLKNSIFYDNNTKYVVASFNIDNSVIELATEAVKNEALISFQAGGAKDVTIKNSTFIGNNAVAKYFIRYNNSARLDRYGYDVSENSIQYMSMTYTNNTFYGLLIADGQWGNYNGVQGYARAKFDVQKNIWYNSGKDIIRRMAGGRFNGSNPMLFAYNTYFNNDKDISASEASYDKSENILKYNPYFKDAANGDFAVGASTEQAANRTGDQRWGTWENTVYNIIIAEMEGGTIEAPATAMADDEVQLVVKPAEGFRLKAGSVKGLMGKSEIEISEQLTFFMPVADVVISAEFEPVYAVSIAEGIENGTVKADVAEAGEGDVVTLTVTPAEGYELESLTVVGATTGEAVTVSEDNQFTMPAEGVTISATFKEVATGIQAVSIDKLENAVIYNLQGQRVEKSQAKGGVFIVNGKKTFLK